MDNTRLVALQAAVQSVDSHGEVGNLLKAADTIFDWLEGRDQRDERTVGFKRQHD